MSGGKTSSRSSNSNSTATDNSNTQINDTEGLVLNFEGSDNNEATIIQSDHDAIKESFSFAESSLDSVSNIAINSFDSVDNAVDGALGLSGEAFEFGSEALSFGGDALDSVVENSERAFEFGENAIEETQSFGRDVLEEAQETNRQALSIAGNAQTNAFAKIKEIAASFSSNAFDSKNILIVASGAGMVLLAIVFFMRKRG